MMVPVCRSVSFPGEPRDEQRDLVPGFLSELGLGSSRALFAQGGRGDIALVERQIPAVSARILNPGQWGLMVNPHL